MNNFQNFDFKKNTPHKFKNIDPENELQLEEIKKTAGDSCDEKLRNIQIKKMRKFKSHLKTYFVGKLSISEKNISIYRHKLEKNQTIEQEKIKREEEKSYANFKDTMFAHENPRYTKQTNNTVIKQNVNKKFTEKKTRRSPRKEEHIYTTLNISDYIK